MAKYHEVKSGIIITPEVKTPKQRLLCEYCNKTFARKWNLKRHQDGRCKSKPTQEEKIEEDEEYEEEEEDETTDKEKLQEEVLNLYRDDMEELKKKTSPIMEIVNEMTESELRLKIAERKMIINGKLSGTLSNSVLIGANRIIGGVLNCTEELNITTMQDECLKDTTKSVLGYYCLDSIPLPMKLGVLYSSHIVCGAYASKMRKQQEQQYTNIEIEEVPEIEKPEQKEQTDADYDPNMDEVKQSGEMYSDNF